MSKRDKRIQKLLRKPAYFPFEDLDIILRDAGYIRRNSGGSHFSYNKPGVPHVLTVPVHNGQVKRTYVVSVIKALGLEIK